MDKNASLKGSSFDKILFEINRLKQEAVMEK